MERPRIPSPYAIFQLTIRIIALFADLIVLGMLIYLSARFSKTLPWSIAAVCWCICTDSAEAAPILLQKRRPNAPRLSVSTMITLDLVCVIFLAVAIFAILFADLPRLRKEWDRVDHRRHPDPAADWLVAAFWGHASLAGYHFALAILYCIDHCRHGPTLSR